MKRRGLVVFAGDPPGILVQFRLISACGNCVFPSLPFMGVMLFLSFVLGNASGEGGTFLVPLSLFFCSSFSSSHFFSLSFSFIFSSFLSPFLPHLILPFSFPFAQTLSIPFFFFSSFPSLFSSSPLFHLIFLSSFFLEGFFFLRELLVLFVSEMQGMTLLIVINCTFIIIKRCFIF